MSRINFTITWELLSGEESDTSSSPTAAYISFLRFSYLLGYIEVLKLKVFTHIRLYVHCNVQHTLRVLFKVCVDD